MLKLSKSWLVQTCVHFPTPVGWVYELPGSTMVVPRPAVETATCLVVTGHKTDTAQDLRSDFKKSEINLGERNRTYIHPNRTQVKRSNSFSWNLFVMVESDTTVKLQSVLLIDTSLWYRSEMLEGLWWIEKTAKALDQPRSHTGPRWPSRTQDYNE